MASRGAGGRVSSLAAAAGMLSGWRSPRGPPRRWQGWDRLGPGPSHQDRPLLPRGSALANTVSQFALALLLFLYIVVKKLHRDTWGGKGCVPPHRVPLPPRARGWTGL